MTLLEFVGSMKDRKTAVKTVKSIIRRVDFDQIDIFLKGGLTAESEVKLVDAEKMPGTQHVVIDGEKYVNLFPVEMLQEFVQAIYLQDRSKTDEELTARVLKYRVKDA